MSFDPEKVDRWDCQNGKMLDGRTVAVMQGNSDGEYVYASDYDQLLKLYQKLGQAFADSIEARSKGL